MAKARRSAIMTRAEIRRVFQAYEDAGLPQPRMVVRRDGVVFEPAPKGAVAERPEQDEAPAAREPWIM